MRIAIAALMMLSVAVLPATAEELAERLAPCLACHGEKGQSETPEVPSLGALPAPYVVIQLYMFREKLRPVELMNQMTQDLSNNDLQQFADFIAKLPAPQPAAGPDGARMERARALVRKH